MAMVSREHKKAATMSKKLKLLRSITNSHANSNISIVLDASKYIKELKQKVEQLHQEVASTQNASDQDPLALVRVQAQEKGFQIHVLSEKKLPGLLVFILEAFEDLGLAVLQARVSCSSRFQFEAVVENQENQEEDGHIDKLVVKQAVSEAIQKWGERRELE